MVVIGCSSRYMPTLGCEVVAWPSPPVATPRMYTALKPEPAPSEAAMVTVGRNCT